MARFSEEIVKIEMLDTNQLQLVLASGGDSSFEHIYREAKGVYWDDDAGAFRGTERVDWTVADWFSHIVSTCDGAAIELSLGSAVEWVGVSEEDKHEILALCAD